MKVIFLHGFFASGACAPAVALREALSPYGIEVLSPDLPLSPVRALTLLEWLCAVELPDLLVGNSCGSFLAHLAACRSGVPALLGNPHLEMSAFLDARRGPQQYKAPREDGKQDFCVTSQLIDEFAALEATQWDYCAAARKVWGLFGEADNIAHYEPLFRQHYSTVHHFPGGHTPTADEVRQYYAPLVRQMLAAV